MHSLYADWHQVETFHGENRPLNASQRNVIDSNRSALCKLIDPSRSFINRLYASKCFNCYHKEYIESGTTTLKKVKKLLNIMRRRSVANYNKFCEALYTCGQPALAKLLQTGGGKIWHEIPISIWISAYKEAFVHEC